MHLMCNCVCTVHFKELSDERHTSNVQAVCKVHSAYFALKSAELFERRRASNVHARAQVHDQSRPWAGHQPGWPYHFPRLLLACLGNFTNMLHGTKSSDWWYGSRFMRISHQQSKSVTLRSTTITHRASFGCAIYPFRQKSVNDKTGKEEKRISGNSRLISQKRYPFGQTK